MLSVLTESQLNMTQGTTNSKKQQKTKIKPISTENSVRILEHGGSCGERELITFKSNTTMFVMYFEESWPASNVISLTSVPPFRESLDPYDQPFLYSSHRNPTKC